MNLLIDGLLAWSALSVLGLVGTAAICRSAHDEDLARGYVDPVDLPPRTPAVTGQ